MVRRGRKLGPPVRPEDSPVIFAAVVLGETSLYKWQMLALERAARGKRIALRAANGSGKTDKVIGILALWFLCLVLAGGSGYSSFTNISICCITCFLPIASFCD